MSASKKTKTSSKPNPITIPSASGPPGWLQTVVALFAIVIFLAMAAQLIAQSVLAGRIYPGVTVAGEVVGGMTWKAAGHVLTNKVKDLGVNVEINGKRRSVSLQDAGVEIDSKASLERAYAEGREQWYVPLGLFTARSSSKLAYAYHVNLAAQQAFAKEIVEGSGRAPVDAGIVIINGKPNVTPESSGFALDPNQLVAAIGHRVAKADPSAIVLTPTVRPAKITTADVSPAVDQTNVLLSVPVTITYQGRAFQPTPKQMGEWITYEKKGPNEEPGLVPRVTNDGIKRYLQTVAVQVNKNPVNRKVRVENGVSTEERAGKEGQQLEQDALAGKIAAAVGAREPLRIEAAMKSVPFQTEYNRVVTLDYNRYIEINLKKQRLWVYEDKKVIFESPITSGATGAGFPTAQGLFSIQAKQTNRNLNGYAIGYDYNVFVKYWMPFYGNFGLHDASWRSAFGGSDYYYNGSHGCVNLPGSTAAFIYGWATVGTPVWVHS